MSPKPIAIAEYTKSSSGEMGELRRSSRTASSAMASSPIAESQNAPQRSVVPNQVMTRPNRMSAPSTGITATPLKRRLPKNALRKIRSRMSARASMNSASAPRKNRKTPKWLRKSLRSVVCVDRGGGNSVYSELRW